MNVGVIGAGVIGSRRARVIAALGAERVALVVDTDLPKAQVLAKELGCDAAADWHAAMGKKTLDLLIIAVPTDALLPIALEAVGARKHVLLEKPFGRTPEDIAPLVERASDTGVSVQAGFTLRHHGHLKRARAAVAEGRIGRVLWARCVYGHGGRLGYERDWRCQPDRVAGGELLDQGIHAVDLFRWFFGEFTEAFAYTSTAFWPIGPLEDNAFGLLKTSTDQIASFHVSWSLWKNQFSFEVFGDRGYVKAMGLGGSYGHEHLIIGTRPDQFGVPKEERVEIAEPERAWEDEWREMAAAVTEKRAPNPSIRDGWEAMRLLWALYASARAGTPEIIS